MVRRPSTDRAFGKFDKQTIERLPQGTKDSSRANLSCIADDGNSTSSESKDFHLPGKTAGSNKRIFARPAGGKNPETPRRSTKLRTANRSGSESSASTKMLKARVGFIPGNEVPYITGGQSVSNSSTGNYMKKSPSQSPSPLPVFNTFGVRDWSMLLEPGPCPIRLEQLVNEIKGIYAGLVMVEKKCIEIHRQQASTGGTLSNEQWHALTALHSTLLHEHHDFFLASQHPSSSPPLRQLATKLAMPGRLWRHGIHSFLELLRRRLPESRDHILAFIYLAYSTMALLMESVPSFEETWIECLGDLARYRMGIEETDLRDREVWSGVARMWYNKAANKSPKLGRIQHHLAVVAEPNIVRQLFYYSKALVSVISFQNARASIMLLSHPFLEGSEIASQHYPLVETTLVKANGTLFTHGRIHDYTSLMDQFCSNLTDHVGRLGIKFRVQGPEIVCSLCAATLDFGNVEAFLTRCFREIENQKKTSSWSTPSNQAPPEVDDLRPPNAYIRDYRAIVKDTTKFCQAGPYSPADSEIQDTTFGDSHEAAAHACYYLGKTTAVIAQRIGDKNVLPYMHVMLAYLFALAFVENALTYVEGCIPWENIMIFLNTLRRSGIVIERFEDENFPEELSGTRRQLPEDYTMRGTIWAQYYFPVGFFADETMDDDERNLEFPRHTCHRIERCLWLGVRLASFNRWISYDCQTGQFSITLFARSLQSDSN